MSLARVAGLVKKTLKDNSTVILSTVAGIGTVATAYLAAKASFEAAEVIRLNEEQNGFNPDRKERLKERTKLVWKLYIPTAVSAGSTVFCIAASHRVETKRTLAAQTAFTVSQRVYSEYRDKVIEEFGDRKDQTIRDKIAEKKIEEKKPPPKELLIAGSGEVLCCELFTMRYFTSSMEALRKAQNEVNAKVISQDYATLDSFYYIIGLKYTTLSSQIGWKSNKLMDLEFSTVLTDDGRPCLAFEYNYTTPL